MIYIYAYIPIIYIYIYTKIIVYVYTYRNSIISCNLSLLEITITRHHPPGLSDRVRVTFLNKRGDRGRKAKDIIEAGQLSSLKTVVCVYKKYHPWFADVCCKLSLTSMQRILGPLTVLRGHAKDQPRDSWRAARYGCLAVLYPRSPPWVGSLLLLLLLSVLLFLLLLYYCYHCFNMAEYGCLWLSLAVYGSAWLSMTVYGRINGRASLCSQWACENHHSQNGMLAFVPPFSGTIYLNEIIGLPLLQIALQPPSTSSIYAP